jgi:FecR protein
MKNFSKTRTLSLIALAFALVCAAAPARAQATRDARLVSVKAGGVNFVAGDVKVRREGRGEWQGVSVKDDLRSGDTARTGDDGRLELLLNPGSYLRAGAATELDLVNSSLESLQVRLARGSAVVEASAYDDYGLDIQVATPGTRVHIVRSGVYRIDVAASGETTVSVQKGRALVGDADALLVVRGGKVARVAGRGGAVEVAKLDKKHRDVLDGWSRERGKELSKVNDALANRQSSMMLASFNFNDMFRAEFPSNYYGLWMWSQGRNCYTFLPFYSGWRSPYGFGYGSFFSPFGYFDCFGCRRSSQPMIVRGSTPAGAPTPPTTIVNGGSSSMPSSGGGSTGGGRSLTPLPPAAGTPMGRGGSDRPTRERTYEPGTRPRDQ